MTLRPGDPCRFARAWLVARGLDPDTAAARARGVVTATGCDAEGRPTVTACWGPDVEYVGSPEALELALRSNFSSRPPACTEAL